MIKAQDQDLLLAGASLLDMLMCRRFCSVTEKSSLSSGRSCKHIILWRESYSYVFLKRRQPFSALGAVVTQAFRGMVDAIAISSGLNYRLWRHRARPVSESERTQWEHIWAELTGS